MTPLPTMSYQDYKECMVLCGLAGLPETNNSHIKRIWAKDENPIFINERNYYFYRFYRLVPKAYYLDKQEVMEYVQLYLERGKHHE